MLGTEAIGLYALGITMIGVVSIFLTFGFGNGLSFISKYNATNSFLNLFYYIINTFLLIFVWLFLFLFLFFFSKAIAYKILNTPQIEPFIHLFGIMIFINSFFGYM